MSIAHEAFQMPLVTTTHFSKPNRVLTPFFQKLRKNASIFIRPIGKRAQKIREKIQPIEKRNQSDDAHAFFENSIEVQRLNAYPAEEFKT